MYQNYIFDLYGTLVDIHTNETKSYLWKKFAILLKLHGAEYTYSELRKHYKELVLREQTLLLQKMRQICHKETLSISDIEISLENVFERLYADCGIAVDKKQIQNIGLFFRTLSLEHIALFEGARELLDRLRSAGKNIYLLSNAQRIFTEPEMRMLDIYDSFDGILYSSDVGIQKPETCFYQALFDKFSLRKRDSVMIGNDRIADIEGARRFGIDSMYIHTVQSTPFVGKLPENCRKLKEISNVYPA